MSRRFTALLILVVVLAVVAWMAWDWLQNHLVVENQSGQPISVFEITICGRTIVFRDILQAARVSSRFEIGVDDHFVVDGRLADGTEIKGEFGYVTNGMYAERPRFVVQQDGSIEFSQHRR